MNEDRLRRSPNVAIIGSTSLLGKELKELIEEGGFPLGRLVLLETEEYAGLLQEFSGDIQITQIITPEALEDVEIAFFACSSQIMQSFIESGAPFPELSIDLTQSGREGTLFLSGLSNTTLLSSRGYYVNPDPAAIVIARVLARLHAIFGVRTASVTVFEPASQRGNSGVEELQEQTVSLLNFQPVENKVFHGQLSFNVLPESAVMARTEERIVRQIGGLLGSAFPKPTVTAVQAPVFHCHGFSLFVELLREPPVDTVRDALAADSSFVLHETSDEPSPVSVAGAHGIHIGRIHESPASPGNIAIWITADNLRLAASNAIRTAENIMLAVIGR